MLWLLWGPPGFACWVPFALVQLSPYLCFISFLYLDSNVLGDDALISWASFLQARRLCVLVRIWAGSGVGAPLDRCRPSSGIFLPTIPGWCFFCGPFVLFLSCFVVLSCASVCWCLVVACWEGADLLALVCDV